MSVFNLDSEEEGWIFGFRALQQRQLLGEDDRIYVAHFRIL